MKTNLWVWSSIVYVHTKYQNPSNVPIDCKHDLYSHDNVAFDHMIHTTTDGHMTYSHGNVTVYQKHSMQRISSLIPLSLTYRGVVT